MKVGQATAPFSIFLKKMVISLRKTRFSGHRNRRKENGQSLVEFALVLPLFMLILMGIMDFGWLFYNYIGVENSARNAARIACVEYQNTNLNKTPGPNGTTILNPYLEGTLYSRTYEFSKYDEYMNDSNIRDKITLDEHGNPTGYYSYKLDDDYYYSQTLDILNAAKSAVTNSTSLQTLTLTYTYDTMIMANNKPFVPDNRYQGDVVVTVNAKMRCLTPVLGVFGDHMMLNLKSTATYKVEKAPPAAADDYD